MRPSNDHEPFGATPSQVPLRSADARSIRACVEDLRSNGIPVDSADERQVRALVHQYHDYFQAMLGHDCSERRVAALIRHRLN